jgi:hypothetical protein
MKKCFIWLICSTCNEPVEIISPCNELGYNAFPTTNFHGELSIEDTEKLRLDLIDKLKKEEKWDRAKMIENNTKVLEITFNK